MNDTEYELCWWAGHNVNIADVYKIDLGNDEHIFLSEESVIDIYHLAINRNSIWATDEFDERLRLVSILLNWLMTAFTVDCDAHACVTVLSLFRTQGNDVIFGELK